MHDQVARHTTTPEGEVPQAFVLIAELLLAMGELPAATPKCVALAVDAAWRVGFNATPAQ